MPGLLFYRGRSWVITRLTCSSDSVRPSSLSVTDYRCCRDSLNATLYIDRRSILLAYHCSHFSYHFMYIFHLIPIDLQSSCSFNSHTLQSLHYLSKRLRRQGQTEGALTNTKVSLVSILKNATFF
ncbi:uncharacterized protein K441DRAFT_136500 [Cenococcum geophilum 1.58]|uniref:uncharacterized protein n=1 Tax=Cenococcum geophilum 1.58 TaxID=794803 RepID=UPI00358E2047|nr:hypothetical protein K441DRAFT_136500 [Cenococcum geophilum 1.58]